MMRFLIPMILLLAAPLFARADEEAELRRFLSLLTAAQIGDEYPAIKKRVPEIGVEQKDAGDENTEALIRTKIGKVVLRGEFNFAKGRLVSHGFSTGELTHGQAHAFLLRCITILEELYGESERHIDLPTESDGPKDSIGLRFNWIKNKTRLGLDFDYRRGFAIVSWGAQQE